MQRPMRRPMAVISGYKILSLICMLMCTLMASRIVCHGQEGSICVSMCYDQVRVSGGTVTLYQVGTYSAGGSSTLQPAEEFAGYAGFQSDIVWKSYIAGAVKTIEKDLEPSSHETRMTDYGISAADYAEELASYAIEQEIPGTTIWVDAAGIAYFGNLQKGIYLLLQKETAAGYQKIEPFLVAVPAVEDGRFVFEVSACPKMEPVPGESEAAGDEAGEYESDVSEKEETEWDEPQTERSDENGSAANSLTENIKKWLVLPQTGQVMWPVPVLSLIGVVMLIVGRIIQRRKGQ